jgi:hypothetical protein
MQTAVAAASARSCTHPAWLPGEIKSGTLERVCLPPSALAAAGSWAALVLKHIKRSPSGRKSRTPMPNGWLMTVSDSAQPGGGCAKPVSADQQPDVLPH